VCLSKSNLSTERKANHDAIKISAKIFKSAEIGFFGFYEAITINMGEIKKNRILKPDTFSIDYGVCTHIGQRDQNQDAVLIESVPVSLNGNGYLFAVADGMGGHTGGGLASRMVCDCLNDNYRRKILEKPKTGLTDISRCLTEAIMRADRYIRLRGLKDDKLADMGTTISCLVLSDTHLIIAHVGDSRIYCLRKGRLIRLTVDHTFVQDMIFEGEVDPAKAHLHPLRHMLTRAVGTGEPLPWVDLYIDSLDPAGRLLLCTDGLYNALSDQHLLGRLSREVTATDAAAKLVKQALQKGARDNTTAIVVDFKHSATGQPGER